MWGGYEAGAAGFKGANVRNCARLRTRFVGAAWRGVRGYSRTATVNALVG